MLITKQFTFDSAHYLEDYHGKCERMHGHTYKLDVTVEGEIGKNGLVIDFVELKKIVKDNVIEDLDHRVLNEMLGNASAENTVVWIWERLKDKFGEGVNLYELKLWETAGSWVTYRGE